MKIIRQDNDRTTLLKELRKREHWRDKEFAFVTSARVAMKERPKDALPVIFAELQHTLTWHPVHWQSLSYHQRKSVLKDKFLASGGHQQAITSKINLSMMTCALRP